MGWSPRWYIPCFVEIGPTVPEKKILKGVYHIFAWRPSWSCDPDVTNNFLFPLPKEAPHKILSLICQVVSEEIFEKCERTHDEGRAPDHGYTITSPG